MNIPKINTASDFVASLWAAKQKDLARQQEASARMLASQQGHKGYFPFFSCLCQEWLDKYITVDPETVEMKAGVQVLQGIDDPVLISGPTGTGKELLARALHGSRPGKFVAVNCTSLPDELLESELFGHTKGAFTGAMNDRVGKFRAAFNGTIFLDEIGDMPLNMQAKLLRVLQEKVVCPIGSDVEEPINCRVIAATNKSLTDVHFREDVLYRLNVFELKTKGLRYRLCDIEEIVDSLGGEGLVNEFEKWKAKIKTELPNHLLSFDDGSFVDTKSFKDSPLLDDIIIKNFFNLSGNVRTLQAQVRRFKVLGKLKESWHETC